jgi:hypothetical protein
MRWTIGLALVLEGVILGALLTISADLYAHKRVERLGGVNVWGYRGPVLPRKAGREIRVAVAGGDLAFGWGVAASETLAYSVRQLVGIETEKPGSQLGRTVGVNLGGMGLAPPGYAAALAHFSYLQLDVVCLVADPRSHVPGPSELPDRRSAAFAAFGYAPILPLVLREKASLIGTPALSALGSGAEAADHLVGRWLRLSTDDPVRAMLDPVAYVDALESAIRTALNTNASVVLVLPLDASDQDRADHERIWARVSADFDARRVRIVDLGDEADMYEPDLRLNPFDFSVGGHRRASEHVAPAVLTLINIRLGTAGR